MPDECPPSAKRRRPFCRSRSKSPHRPRARWRPSASSACCAAAFALKGEGHRREHDDQRASAPSRAHATSGSHARIRCRAPKPTHRKTIEAPSSAPRISSTDSSAALTPTSGSPPVPRPRVMLRPSLDFFRGDRGRERLHVGVQRDEVGVFHAIKHDAVEGVRSRSSADSDDFNRDVLGLGWSRGSGCG